MQDRELSIGSTCSVLFIWKKARGGGGGGGGAGEHPYCFPKKLTFFNLYATACFVQSQSVHSFLGGVLILVRLLCTMSDQYSHNYGFLPITERLVYITIQGWCV